MSISPFLNQPVAILVTAFSKLINMTNDQAASIKDKQIVSLTDDAIRMEMTHIQYPLIISKSFVHCQILENRLYIDRFLYFS